MENTNRVRLCSNKMLLALFVMSLLLLVGLFAALPSSAQADTISKKLGRSFYDANTYYVEASNTNVVCRLKDFYENSDKDEVSFSGIHYYYAGAFGTSKVKVYQAVHPWDKATYQKALDIALDHWGSFEVSGCTFAEYVRDNDEELRNYYNKVHTTGWVEPKGAYIRTDTVKCTSASIDAQYCPFKNYTYTSKNIASLAFYNYFTPLSKSFLKSGKFVKGKGYKVLSKGKKIKFTKAGKVTVKYKFGKTTGKIVFKSVHSTAKLKEKGVVSIKSYLQSKGYKVKTFKVTGTQFFKKDGYLNVEYTVKNSKGKKISQSNYVCFGAKNKIFIPDAIYD